MSPPSDRHSGSSLSLFIPFRPEELRDPRPRRGGRSARIGPPLTQRHPHRRTWKPAQRVLRARAPCDQPSRHRATGAAEACAGAGRCMCGRTRSRPFLSRGRGAGSAPLPRSFSLPGRTFFKKQKCLQE